MDARQGPSDYTINSHVIVLIDKGNEQESKKMVSAEAKKESDEQRINQLPKASTVRINIRYCGPIRRRIAQMGVLWTTHDVSNETDLSELFRLHHLKGGPPLDGMVALQQINKRFKHMTETERCWWDELDVRRVVDTDWIFEDGEVWLSSSTHI